MRLLWSSRAPGRSRCRPGTPHHATPRASKSLLYRGSNNELLTLYLRRSDGKVRADQWRQNGLRVCVWQDDVLGMVVAGNVSTAAMQRLRAALQR